MATLAELLALMPDNTTGDISAEDMRTVTTGVWEQTDLAVKAINGETPDATGEIEIPPGITLLNEGEEPPLGAPPGIYGFIPAGPEPLLFETVSYDTDGTEAVCPIPEGVQVGDAVIFVPGFVPTTPTVDGITCDDPGWTEILDYSPQQSRKPAAYVYRVEDATALANLGATVTATVVDSGRRAGITYAIPGSLVASAWPAYSSGSNRSPATINDNTTTGCTLQSFATATVPFHKVVAVVMQDADSEPAASDGFTEVAWATGSSGGAEPFTLTMLVKDLAATPIPEAVITHPVAASSAHGGGQFIIPVA